ncbi:hypothetical protein CLV28_1939 [Sediminihabitans luteus]|uniref:Tetratricopeptide repeat protein n=1 Tax=Sediminihabitans luteus TaxID=1138585 RepID=A0A2M9CR84_9CELL|nr:hypothetical protein [Sediminihabitans luteus]PJJ74442.1 hypothetical protein CLV28_1939 [Sediminihabitans luteus]
MPGGPGFERRDDRPVEPDVPETVTWQDLDRDVRGRLRTLSKANAEQVGAHLVMAGRLIDTDPELAYEHAQAAVRRAGRVDVVREAAGLAAYQTGRYAEALRELRTVRRLNGSSEHLPIMADAERGLGRPERAIALSVSDEASTLDADGRAELSIVVSGARSDLGEHEAALAVLDAITGVTGELSARVAQARAGVLEALGRPDEAAAVLAGIDPRYVEPDDADDVVVFDLTEESEESEESEDDDEPVENTVESDTLESDVVEPDGGADDADNGPDEAQSTSADGTVAAESPEDRA